MKKLAVITGSGELPLIISREARQKGYAVFGIGVKEEVDDSIKDRFDNFRLVSISKPLEIMKILTDEGIRELVFAGRVNKALIYAGMKLDDLMRIFLSPPDKSTMGFLTMVSEYLKKVGIAVLDPTIFIREILADEGVMTKRAPNEREKDDLQFGVKMARGLADMDIGQCVVAKNGVIAAVEAIEGTDETIKRGCGIAGEDCVVIKLARSSQDMRFDVPTVGITTLKIMKECKSSVIGIEAGKTIMIDKQEFINYADANNISVVGI